MTKSLRIALWNANGIQTKTREVVVFLNMNNTDILLVSETHFTNRSYLRIPYYSVYHTEHPDGTAHGGTAVIVRSTIVHHELKKFQQDFLQATTIEVRKLPTPLVISAVYCPPRHTLTKTKLKSFFDTLGNIFY